MKKNYFALVILTLLVLLLFPNTALGANNFDSGTGTLTIDSAPSASSYSYPAWDLFQQELMDLVGGEANLGNVTTLKIVGGVIYGNSDNPNTAGMAFDDISFIQKMLTGLEVLDISGDASFNSNNIRDYAFMTQPTVLPNLTTVIINPTNSSLTFGNYAFNSTLLDASKLVSVSIPKAVQFGDNAFYNQRNLTSVSLDNVTTFGNGAFGYNYNLSTISLPQTTTFGTEAFTQCFRLSSVSLPQATVFGNSSFTCSNVPANGSEVNNTLTSLSLPEVTTVGQSFLNGYTAMTSVSMPKVTSIGNYAFDKSKAGIELTLGETPPTVSTSTFLFYSMLSSTHKLNIPSSAEAAYKAAADGNTGDGYWFTFALPVYYSVNYSGYGNTGGSAPTDPSSGTYTSGDSVLVLGNTGNLEKTGYEFIGWTLNGMTGTVYSAGQSVTIGSSNLIFYAKWDPISYQVRFNKDAGDATGSMADQAFIYGTSNNLSSNGFSRSGYNFSGWATSSGSSTVVYSDEQFVGNLATNDGDIVNLYAVWTPSNRTVSFVSNGGSAVSDIVVVAGGNIDDRPESNRTDWYLEGWYTSSSLQAIDKVSFPYQVNDNITLYAKWSKAEVITFNKNDGSATPETSTQIFLTGETKNLETNSFTRTGYTFMGWAATSDGSVLYTDGEVYTTANDGTANTATTLYAVWDGLPYTVTYDANGGQGSVPDKNVHYDDVIKLDNGSSLSQSGYVLDGWNISGTRYELSALYQIAGDVSAEAIWALDSDGDGISDVDETASGTDPNDADDKMKTGRIEITVLNEDGSAAGGYILRLNSEPVEMVTDTSGKTIFGSTTLSQHTLTLINGTTEIGTYALGFARNTGNSTMIVDDASTDSDGRVSTNVAGNFLALNVTIQRNAAGNWQLILSDYSEILPNPETGDPAGIAFWWAD